MRTGTGRHRELVDVRKQSASARVLASVSSHHTRPTTEPTDECYIALVILLGPFAFVVRWIWRVFLMGWSS
jgi:hypothetical protein